MPRSSMAYARSDDVAPRSRSEPGRTAKTGVHLDAQLPPPAEEVRDQCGGLAALVRLYHQS